MHRPAMYVPLLLVGALLGALLSACGAAQTTATPYSVEREEIEGFTRAAIRDIRVRRADGIAVGLELVAREANPEVRVETTTVSNDWRYRDCRRMRFVADGQPIPVQDVRHEGETVDGQVVEHLAGDVRNWRFREIAAADELQAELCEDVVLFERPERRAMADLVRVAWEGGEPTAPDWRAPERQEPSSYDDLRF
ncbi:MAG: hypothetical protein ACOCUS_02335 [Polyangiales bacterium]